mmetsp:Transcript_71981/g.153968  ORF Transcript_71981/g.153968 Transcript_71981/m.153968 type:complete len:1127 (-) Transcript_71981:113-3493(-)
MTGQVRFQDSSEVEDRSRQRGRQHRGNRRAAGAQHAHGSFKPLLAGLPEVVAARSPRGFAPSTSSTGDSFERVDLRLPAVFKSPQDAVRITMSQTGTQMRRADLYDRRRDGVDARHNRPALPKIWAAATNPGFRKLTGPRSDHVQALGGSVNQQDPLQSPRPRELVPLEPSPPGDGKTAPQSLSPERHRPEQSPCLSVNVESSSLEAGIPGTPTLEALPNLSALREISSVARSISHALSIGTGVSPAEYANRDYLCASEPGSPNGPAVDSPSAGRRRQSVMRISITDGDLHLDDPNSPICVDGTAEQKRMGSIDVDASEHPAPNPNSLSVKEPTSPERGRLGSRDIFRSGTPPSISSQTRLSLTLDVGEVGLELDPAELQEEAASEGDYGLPALEERCRRLDIALASDGEGESFSDADIAIMHGVFRRFLVPRTQEMRKEDLPEMMQDLGFVMPSSEKFENLANEVTPYNQLDFEEFLVVARKYVLLEREFFRNKFEEHDGEGCGMVGSRDLNKLLVAIGLLPFRAMIQEGLEAVHLKDNLALTFDEFLRFLLAYRYRHTFTRTEVAVMKRAFERSAAEDGPTEEVSEVASKPTPVSLPASNLLEGLVQVFGLQAEEHLVEVSERLLKRRQRWGLGDAAPPLENLSFPEFLMASRRTREGQLRVYQGVFDKHDKDGIGSISTSQLQSTLQHLDFEALDAVIKEVLSDMEHDPRERMNFEEFCHFLMVFHKRDGFLRKDIDELEAVFNKFQSEAQSIKVTDLSIILRELGHTIAMNDLHLLAGTVDVNRSGTLDFQEFLRLMRLRRDAEIKKLKLVFYRFSVNNGRGPRVPIGDLVPALKAALGCEVPKALLNMALMRSTDVDFEAFLGMTEIGRTLCLRAQRRNAGFSDEEMRYFREVFDAYDIDKSGDMNAHEVQNLLHSLGTDCKTREEQKALLAMLNEARSLAMDAGAGNGTPQGSGLITFWELVQLLRIIRSNEDRKTEEQIMNVTAELHFMRNEVEEFREIFINWSRKAGANRIVEHHLATVSEGLSLPSFSRLIGSLGVTISQKQKAELEAHIKRGLGPDDVKKGQITFVGFLRMMRWLLDSDFARINAVTAQVAEQNFSAQFQGGAGEGTAAAVGAVGA